MNGTYDIFEVRPDGTRLWRAAVIGKDMAMEQMQELAAQSTNEFRLMHLATSTVVATCPVKEPKSRSATAE